MSNLSLPCVAEELLPHKGLMCCIDRLVHITANSARADVVLQPTHALLEAQTLSRAGFIELAAQTAGAMQGYAQRSSGQAPKMGFLVGVQNFQVFHDAQQGDRLLISVETMGELEGVSVLAFDILCEEIILATGRLKVYVATATPDSVLTSALLTTPPNKGS